MPIADFICEFLGDFFNRLFIQLDFSSRPQRHFI